MRSLTAIRGRQERGVELTQFHIVFSQLVGMAVMMLVGIVCVKAHVLGQKAMDGICSFILKVGIPFIVFSNAVSGTTRADLAQSGVIMLLDIVMYVLLISMCTLIAKLMGLKAERGRMFCGTFVFGNVGFMGLPLLMALYPGKGALYFALLSLVDQCVMWTYGVWTCKKVRDVHSRTDKDPARGWLQRVRSVISPALVAVALSLVVVLIGVPIPEEVLAPIKAIGQTASPLSMVYLGGLVVLRDWTGVLRKPELYVGVVLKMLLFPMALFALFTTVPPMLGLTINPDIVHTMAICAGMPTMVALVMFAEKEHNQPQYAIGMVVANTIASLFTLTAVSFVVF